MNDEEKQQAVWEIVGKWKDVAPTPDFKKRFMSKIDEPRPSYWKKWFVWDWPEIFIPASAFAAMLVVVISFLVWPPYKKPDHTLEMVASFDLLENKELLIDMELLSDLDVMMAIDETDDLLLSS